MSQINIKQVGKEIEQTRGITMADAVRNMVALGSVEKAREAYRIAKRQLKVLEMVREEV